MGKNKEKWRGMVEDLFGYECKELLDHFSCAIRKNILLHGRLYICDSFIGFYSRVFGKETKVVIPFQDIVAIEKRKTAFIFAALEIRTEEQQYFFQSFFAGYRDRCYKLCRVEWEKSIATNAVATPTPTAHESHPGVAVSSSGLEVAEDDNDDDDDDDDESDSEDGERESGFEESEERKDRKGTRSGPETAAAKGSPKSPRKAKPRTGSDVGHAIEGRDWSSLPDDAAREEEDEDDEGESEVLPQLPPSFRQELDKQTKITDVVLPLGPAAVFREFLSDEAGFSLPQHFNAQGDTEVSASTWVEVEVGKEDEEAEDSVPGSVICRELRYRYHLKGYGPFAPKSTRVENDQRARRYQRDVFVIETISRSLDVPYGDYFTCNDTWLIEPEPRPDGDSDGSPSAIPRRARVRIFGRVVFFKRTMFRKKIEKTGMAGMTKRYEDWAEAAKAHASASAASQREEEKDSDVSSSTQGADAGDTASASFSTPDVVRRRRRSTTSSSFRRRGSTASGGSGVEEPGGGARVVHHGSVAHADKGYAAGRAEEDASLGRTGILHKCVGMASALQDVQLTLSGPVLAALLLAALALGVAIGVFLLSPTTHSADATWDSMRAFIEQEIERRLQSSRK